MKRLITVCMLAALASPSLFAQRLPSDEPRRAIPDMSTNSPFGQSANTRREAEETNRRGFKDSKARLTALRAQLASGWQSLGMPKDAAEQVAATYAADGNVTAHRVTVEGKSDKEIAAMLQSALASKNYVLANQTLLEFQRKKLKHGEHDSPNDKN